jgi:hypothetical protein
MERATELTDFRRKTVENLNFDSLTPGGRFSSTYNLFTILHFRNHLYQ